MSPSVPGALKIARGSLIAVGTVAAGTAIGLAVQRRVVARNVHSDADWFLPTFTPNVHEFTTSDGTTLHVEIDEPAGDANPLTVILCHGYALSSASLVFQRAVLEDRARVISYDQRSHGKSALSNIAFGTVDQLGQDLSELIDAFAPQGPLMLVGHSMGGMTIMALAELRPELFRDRVKAITFIATTAGGMTEVTFGMPAVMRSLVHRAAPVMASALAKTKGLVEVSRRAGGDISEMIFRSYSFGSHPSKEASAFVAEMIDDTPIDVLAEFLPALQEHDKYDVLSVCAQCDVLVVVGDADRLTPVVFSERLASGIHGSKLAVIQDGGHMVGIEHHDEVNHVLLEQLERVEVSLGKQSPKAASLWS